MKITENESNYSQKVTDRFLQLLEENKLFYSEELRILEVLLNRYCLLTISDYARKKNLTPNGVKYLIDHEKIATIEINGHVFIIGAFHNLTIDTTTNRTTRKIERQRAGLSDQLRSAV